MRSRFNIRLVRFDIETEAPVRDAKGRCIECRPGEIGEAIGKIGSDARSNFTGYAEKAATEKKVLRDAFEPGDAWFRTGDLMRQDAEGYFFFVDRIGDTFRWKGENVSTGEVAAAISSCTGVIEANVYGVTVDGADGRAGMASLVVDESFDLKGLEGLLDLHLPAYARPLFLRLQPQFEITGTFKYRKVDLVEEGFDPTKVSDPIYFRDSEQGFIPLTAELYRRLQTGEIRI